MHPSPSGRRCREATDEGIRATNMKKTETEWMQQALLLAQAAEKSGEVPVGAVIVSQNEMIGHGWNQPISSHDPTAHAEIIALREAAQHRNNYRLVDTTLYVTLEPCAMCLGAMLHARVEHLVFGAFDLKAGAVISTFSLLDRPVSHKIRWKGGVLEEECSKILKDFFKSKR